MAVSLRELKGSDKKEDGQQTIGARRRRRWWWWLLVVLRLQIRAGASVGQVVGRRRSMGVPPTWGARAAWHRKHAFLLHLRLPRLFVLNPLTDFYLFLARIIAA